MAGNSLSRLDRTAAAVSLTRPVNCGLTAASALVGALSSGVRPLPAAALVAAAATAFIAAAGNAFNDVMDVEIDRINRPSRPLPAGRLSRSHALWVAGGAAGAGVALAFAVSGRHGLAAAAVTLLLVLYSSRLKRTVLSGNLLVAGVAATVFPFGATAAGAWGRSWVPAGLAFLFHLGREILKDMEDVAGDRAGNANTLAVRRGLGPARRLASGLLLVLTGFALLPWAAGLYGAAYGGGIVLLGALVGHVLAELYRDPALLPSKRLGRELKAGMFLGLAAVVLAEIAG